jgi:phosphoribosylpyrophosphate synthetase
LMAMRQHCTHRPTLLTLTQAQALQGRMEAARASAQRLMAIAPALSASQYCQTFPGGETAYARRLAQALREAGVPP